MTRLAILDVGHGVCGVVFDRDTVVMIDCPPGDVVHRFLRNVVGSRRIDHVFISHAHKDHCGGLPEFLELENGFHVGRVWMNDEQDQTSETYRAILASFKRRREQRRPVPRSPVNHESPEEPIVVGGVGVSAILPYHEDRAKRGDANSLSAVVRVSSADGTGIALFTGDIDEHSLALASLQESSVLRCQWLVYPHHGGDAARDNAQFAAKLLQLTLAKWVVFSFGRKRGRRPLPEVVDVVNAAAARVICTQLSRNCSEHGVQRYGLFASESEEGASLLRGGVRCAGTFLVDLKRDAIDWPGASEHDSFVRGIQGSLCADPL